MKIARIFFLVFALTLPLSSTAKGGEFRWMEDFDLRAGSDLSDFSARVAMRFSVGNIEVWAVLNKVGSPSDTYMVFRLAEMAGQPVSQVVNIYDTYKGKGWGVIAKHLGIKPGSKQFHELKTRQDLYCNSPQVRMIKSNGKSKGKGRGRK